MSNVECLPHLCLRIAHNHCPAFSCSVFIIQSISSIFQWVVWLFMYIASNNAVYFKCVSTNIQYRIASGAQPMWRICGSEYGLWVHLINSCTGCLEATIVINISVKHFCMYMIQANTRADVYNVLFCIFDLTQWRRNPVTSHAPGLLLLLQQYLVIE